MVDGMIAMLEAPAGTHGPINLGNPDEFTIGELASAVLECTGSSAQIVTRPLPLDDPTRRQPDITLARDLLDWSPRVPLAEGLARTIEWFTTIDIAQWRPPTPNWDATTPERVGHDPSN